MSNDGIKNLNKPRWNYENCQAQLGSVVIGECPETWWCYDKMGKRVACIKVIYGDSHFFISDDFNGRSKVFERGGGPDSAHRSLSNCYGFEATSEIYGSEKRVKKEVGRDQPPKGPRHTKPKRKAKKQWQI